MSPVKQDVMALLNNLPDDCSLEDIQYHLYVLEKVRKGLGSSGIMVINYSNQRSRLIA